MWGLLTAAVRSTSFRLLRIKQASPLSILQSTRSEHPQDCLCSCLGHQGKGWTLSRPHLTLTSPGWAEDGPRLTGDRAGAQNRGHTWWQSRDAGPRLLACPVLGQAA